MCYLRVSVLAMASLFLCGIFRPSAASEPALSEAALLSDDGLFNPEGCSAEMLESLSLKAGEGGHSAETVSWEMVVLSETCRQARDLQAPSYDPRPQPLRLRAAQLLLFQGESMEHIYDNLTGLRDAGVNTVIIRVFQNNGDRSLLRGQGQRGSGVYFKTDAAPVIADYLGDIIPLCRRLGLSVFAWMTTRQSDWLLSADPGLSEKAYDPETGRILRARGLNIFHPKVREKLTAVYRDLARYDIDGILFQDDLVLKIGEGFSPEAIASYLSDGGPAVSPEFLFRLGEKRSATRLFSPDNYTPPLWDWVAWKNRRLLGLADELMAAARRVRPGLRFALNLYYETVLNPRMALAWYAQDLEAAQAFPFDYFSLMSYHRQIKKELSLTGEEALGVITTMSRQAIDVVDRPERIIVKIQALDWDTLKMLPREELDLALQAASAESGISLAFVRSRSDPPLDIIRKHFRP